MATLAYCILGGWESFQAMPIMGTFQLLLIVIALHFMVQYMNRKPLNVITLWTTVVFLFITSTMIFLGLSIFEMWEDWQVYPIIGFGIWTGLLYILYLTPKGMNMLLRQVMFYWSWFLFIGISTSMILVYFLLLEIKEIWPLYPTLITLGGAILATCIMIFQRNKNGLPSQKASTE